MAYHESRSETVLFGGGNESDLLVDTWTFDGSLWHLLIPTVSPPYRAGHGAVYDRARDRTVVFGGFGGPQGAIGPTGYLNDTWLWDGQSWSSVSPPNSPPPRIFPAIAYDSVRQRIVLFGGYGGSGYLNDTWEWDGSTWTQVPTSAERTPPPRNGGALVFDEQSSRTLLFGGASGHVYFGDTWEWDGAAWKQLASPVSPTPRAFSPMSFDARRGRVLLFGGQMGAATRAMTNPPLNPPLKTDPNSMLNFLFRQLDGAVLDDTWEWDGASWNNISPGTHPPRRFLHSLVYDRSREMSILFGGRDGDSRNRPWNDTWEWDGSKWTRPQDTVVPVDRTKYAMAYDHRRNRVVMFGGRAQGSPREDTWEWDGMRWQEVTRVGPVARSDHAMASAPGGGVVVFGGQYPYEDPHIRDDTWVWDGQVWTDVSPAISPPGRVWHVMALDQARQKVVLFGGSGGSGMSRLTDTWEWDGVTWTQKFPSTSPPWRMEAMMAYDEVRQKLVLFGGSQQGSTKLNDTWEWDGNDWKRVTPVESPAVRCCGGMGFDRVRGTVVLLGGSGAGFREYLSDSWEWKDNSWQKILVTHAPTPRFWQVVSTDPLSGRALLFGGYRIESRSISDTWELLAE